MERDVRADIEVERSQGLREPLCKNCPTPQDRSEIKECLWQEGEDGTRFKWNKVGTVKDYYFICKVCGHEQHFIPL